MKKLAFISILFLLAGCSGPLKSSWNNFRAYYNTYYNAKKSFGAGLKQVDEQPVTVDTDEPVRVHRAPNGAGLPHFENTIDKGYRLLQKFPESKWANDALFLIGKSYYYQEQFYQALRSFEELYVLDPGSRMRHYAVIWKARTLLDLGRHQEAVLYLEDELFTDGEEWQHELKAEALVLLAEHHAIAGNWELAAGYLGEAVFEITEKPFSGRSFFLYGQALERLGRYGEAFYAYDQVSAGFPDYEYVFRANLQKGRVARLDGNLSQALSIFNAMENDDKNFQRLYELDYEIARTREVMGNSGAAVRLYNQLLHSGADPLPEDFRARVHYRLGNLYSREYGDFEMAAAYYDSSSMQIANPGIVDREQDVSVLASAYGNFAELNKEISRIDSLLWLGTLTAAELDSVIDKVREQKRRGLRQSRQEEKATEDDIMVNINEGNESTDGDPAHTSRFGFLNHKNKNLVASSRSRFRAVWGRRPLVDDWRRAEAVVQIAEERGETPQGRYRTATAPSGPDGGELSDEALGIDLSEIPVTAEARNILHRKRSEALYEAGSLFFLSLDLPDSAAAWFRKVLRSRPYDELKAKTMYALFELYHLEHKEDSASRWGNRILQEYPGSVYAARVQKRTGIRTGTSREPDSSASLRAEIRAIETAEDTVSLPERAEEFRTLALENQTSELAPFIHYRAIRDYAEAARDQTDSAGIAYLLRPESSRPDSADTFSSEGTVPGNIEPLFAGEYWDSVRTLIEEHHRLFPGTPHRNQLQVLERILDVSSR